MYLFHNQISHRSSFTVGLRRAWEASDFEPHVCITSIYPQMGMMTASVWCAEEWNTATQTPDSENTDTADSENTWKKWVWLNSLPAAESVHGKWNSVDSLTFGSGIQVQRGLRGSFPTWMQLPLSWECCSLGQVLLLYFHLSPPTLEQDLKLPQLMKKMLGKTLLPEERRSGTWVRQFGNCWAFFPFRSGIASWS